MIRSATVLLLLTLMVIGFLNLAERGVQAPSCEVFRVDCLIAKHQEFAAGIIGATGARCLLHGLLGRPFKRSAYSMSAAPALPIRFVAKVARASSRWLRQGSAA